MNITKIEWTDYSWNPITGCNKGCAYCYAKKIALRLKGRSGYDKDNPFKQAVPNLTSINPKKSKYQQKNSLHI